MFLFIIIYLLGAATALLSIKVVNQKIEKPWNRLGLHTVLFSWVTVLEALFVMLIWWLAFYLEKYTKSKFRKDISDRVNKLRAWCNLPPKY